MKKLAVAKKIITTIVGVGTTKIVHGIIKNNVDTNTLPDKVTVTAASAAIGYSVSEITSKYTDAKIDELVDAYNKFKNRQNPEND